MHEQICNFHAQLEKDCAILRYYASSSGNFSPPCRDNHSDPYEDAVGWLSPNVGMELPLLAV